MNIKVNFCNLSLLCMLLSGCEGLKETDGIVLNHETLKPVPDVEIHLDNAVGQQNTRTGILTDSSGKFHFKKFVGAGLEGLNEIKLIFTKQGYHSLSRVVKNGTKNDTVFLSADYSGHSLK